MKKYHAWLKVSSFCVFFFFLLLTSTFAFPGNVQSQQVWGVSWYEACAPGLQRCTGELLICLLVFWISKLTAKYVSRLRWGGGREWGGGMSLSSAAKAGKEGKEGRKWESNHSGVWRPVAHRCLSATAAGASTAEWNCSEGGRNTNKPPRCSMGSQGGRWDLEKEQEVLVWQCYYSCQGVKKVSHDCISLSSCLICVKASQLLMYIDQINP